MRRLFFAFFLVVACATGAAAGAYEDAISALKREDYGRAAQLFRPLAEQGNTNARNNLGRMYANGQGVPLDYQEAVKWYRMAAKQGNGEAQFSLGLMYDSGQGVPQDFIRAHMWYNLAAAALSDDSGKKAMEHRDRVASQVAAVQLAKAQEMARRCQQSQFKECD